MAVTAAGNSITRATAAVKDGAEGIRVAAHVRAHGLVRVSVTGAQGCVCVHVEQEAILGVCLRVCVCLGLCRSCMYELLVDMHSIWRMHAQPPSPPSDTLQAAITNT